MLSGGPWSEAWSSSKKSITAQCTRYITSHYCNVPGTCVPSYYCITAPGTYMYMHYCTRYMYSIIYNVQGTCTSNYCNVPDTDTHILSYYCIAPDTDTHILSYYCITHNAPDTDTHILSYYCITYNAPDTHTPPYYCISPVTCIPAAHVYHHTTASGTCNHTVMIPNY